MNEFLTASVVISAIGLRGVSRLGANERGSRTRHPHALLQRPQCRNVKDAPNSSSSRPRRVGSPAEATISAIPATRSWPRSASDLRAIPDLKWEIKEVLISGNHVIVRGEATGTPAGNLWGHRPMASRSSSCRSMFIPSTAARLLAPIMSRIGRARSAKCRRNSPGMHRHVEPDCTRLTGRLALTLLLVSWLDATASGSSCRADLRGGGGNGGRTCRRNGIRQV